MRVTLQVWAATLRGFMHYGLFYPQPRGTAVLPQDEVVCLFALRVFVFRVLPLQSFRSLDLSDSFDFPGRIISLFV